MAVLPVIPPRIAGVPGIDSPQVRSYSGAQGALFREASFLQLITTGTTTGKTVAQTGALIAASGPIFSAPVSINSTAATVNGNITITGVATAGAPSTSYYVYTTYTATGTESLPGPEFIVNTVAGYTFSINVASAGAPAGATNFAAYVSTYEGAELLQQATKTTTALGAAFTVPFPLVNSVGVNLAPTNANTLIVGISAQDSQSVWATGVGGSFTAGGISQLLGAWMPPPTLGPIDPSQYLVTSLVNAQPFEICLTTPWSNSLIGTQVGLVLDASGWHTAAVGGTAFATIISKAFGSATDVGGVGDTNSRVNCVALSTVVI